MAFSRARSTVATRANGTSPCKPVIGNAPNACGSLSFPLRRTSQLWRSISTLPADKSRNHTRTVSANCPGNNPKASKAWASKRTCNSGSSSAIVSTRSTPLTCSSAFLIFFACTRKFSSSATPCTAIIAAGNAFAVVISRIIDSTASLGNKSLVFWISRRKSAIRLSNIRSSMSSKRTSKLEIFSRLLLETNFISGTPRIASSSGSVTRFSTSSALAPGNAVMIEIQLKLIVGSC